MLVRKLVCLLIPVLLGVSAALPGRAQQSSPNRFAFADTTLLRDTLGLHFDRLFDLADSLRMTPDTLRAIAIRYGFAPPRLVALADSLRMPVDSVGPYLDRERFNPLSAASVRVNRFSYNTSYNIQETRSTWNNASDYSFTWDQFFIRNNANIRMERYTSGVRTTIRQNRNTTTEAGWKLTPDYSVGGRAILGRFDSNDQSSISSVGETRDEFQVSIRTRQHPRDGLSSELNLFSGLLDLNNSRQGKHGLTGDLNGRLSHHSGTWFSHEITGQMTANLTRTLVPQTGLGQNTRDLLGNMNGTLNLFEQSPVGFNGTYHAQGSRVGAPDDSGLIRPVRTSDLDASGTLRGAYGNRGLLNVTPDVSRSEQITALGGPSTRSGHGLAADGRYEMLGTVFESRFDLHHTSSEVPRASLTGGYGEDIAERGLDGTVTRRLLGRINTQVNAHISLARYRYHVIGDYGTPPVSRDLVSQSYQINGGYEATQNFSTTLSLQVGRNQTVNLPAASASTNNTERAYHAEWQWTYRLMRGLTATQRNRLGATYTAYNFIPVNDHAALDFGTTTTLNAVLSPRLSVDLTHIRGVQPSGNYTRAADGLYYFQRADQNTQYSLSSRINYTPTAGLSLQLQPFFQSAERSGATGGVVTPQRIDRTLNFNGSANINLRVSRKGQLSGNIGRTFVASRFTTFATGLPDVSPRSQTDYWNGTLNFSWSLQ